MATFVNEIKKPNNDPMTLVHMEPKQRLISGWVLDTGTKYYIDLTYYVVDCSEDGSSLTQAATSSVSANEWFFDADIKRLWLDVGEAPSDAFIHVTYRLFFSTRPIDLPFDMSTGREVPYIGLLNSTSKFKDEIDPDDLIGIALSGTGSLKFNNDGSWQSIYSKLFWETSSVKIYLGFPDIAVNEYQLIYKGFVDSKSYSPLVVSFRLKDFIEKLRSETPLNLFTDADGDITANGDPKRRIYGRAKVLGVSVDKIKDGYALTGTFSKTGDRVITGAGSSLLAEATAEDTLLYTNGLGEESEFSIESVDSDLLLTMSEDIDQFENGSTLTIQPAFPVPTRNRSHFVCDHTMREPTTTVVSSNSFRSLVVADTTDFFANDKIKINGELTTIKNVSEGNLLILLTALTFIPIAAQSVVKQPINDVWVGDKKLVIDRDYSITNASPSKVVLTSSAEFNITKPQPVSDGSSTGLTFTGSSREVTGNIAFKDFFRPWDYVRSNDLTHTTWYQILEVREDKLLLRTAYAGTTRTEDGERKNVSHVDDDSKILIDANGLTEDGVKTGVWVRTASQVTNHLLGEQGLSVNAASFAQAKLDASCLISLAIPLTGDSSRPRVRDVLDLVNKTVLGSLHENSSREIVFNVLSPKKAVIDTIFRDDDFISYKFDAKGKNIAKKVTSNYRHSDASIFTGEPESLVYERENEFIANVTDIEREEQQDLYVWETVDAETLTQRISLLRENSNTVVQMNSNTLFLDKSLNELVYLELRDMFERFGTAADKNFIGVINSLTKGNGQTSLEITDLGGFYNKIATYADSAASAYSSTDSVERAKNGHYTDANGIITDDTTYRMHVYG